MKKKDETMIIYCRKYIHDRWSMTKNQTIKEETKQCLDWLEELKSRL